MINLIMLKNSKGHMKNPMGHIQNSKSHMKNPMGHIQNSKSHMKNPKDHMENLKGYIMMYLLGKVSSSTYKYVAIVKKIVCGERKRNER